MLTNEDLQICDLAKQMFLTSLPGREHAGGGCLSFSCTSALPIPYCLSEYCSRGKEPGDSCQKNPHVSPFPLPWSLKQDIPK